jgi:2-oxoisovalerate dehydrogenase E1 component alpha subunit
VLDEDGVAQGHGTPARAETLRTMLRNMALTRAFDERMFRGSARARPAST